MTTNKFYIFGGDTVEVRESKTTPVFHESKLYLFIGYQGLRYSTWIQEVIPSNVTGTEVTTSSFTPVGDKMDIPLQVYMDLVAYEGQFLHYVPENKRTLDMCIIALAHNPSCIPAIPESILTYEMCLDAVSDDGWALKYVPDEMKTPELCLAAVSKYGEAIADVPSEMLTEEMCHKAVLDDWSAIKYIPDGMKTEKLCLLAIHGAGR